MGGDLRSQPNVFDSPLADSFDILSFDQRGTGPTDKPDVTFTMAQDAAAVMDAVGWDSAHVIGISFGGMVAQELALRHPQRVRSLVLCCSTAGGAGGSSYPIHELSGLSPAERSRKVLAIGDSRYNEAWQAAHAEETERLLQEAAANASPFLKEPGGTAGHTQGPVPVYPLLQFVPCTGNHDPDRRPAGRSIAASLRYDREVAHQIASNPLPPADRLTGSVGQPTGVEVVILGPDGDVLPPGQQGEIAIRGSNVMNGYLNNPEANASAFVNGFLRTGDLGQIDTNGYITLHGRFKELINRGGEKIPQCRLTMFCSISPASRRRLPSAYPTSSTVKLSTLPLSLQGY